MGIHAIVVLWNKFLNRIGGGSAGKLTSGSMKAQTVALYSDTHNGTNFHLNRKPSKK